MNFWCFFVAALIPLILGALWYNPVFGFGKAWIKSTGLLESELRQGNMALVFILVYVFGLFISEGLFPFVVHQASLTSLLTAHPEYGQDGSALIQSFTDFATAYKSVDRSFSHGALHGSIVGLTLALPILGINALFERKSWKYIGIHAGYWILTLALMGGVICKYA
ncbi:MAG: DUF1761 domain-containing protein [Saprospiraceae bacterium]|nr:DUF1761 domain-containing protein [Saprospiraceae bacterium]